MLGGFCSIINSAANNSVKTEKYLKGDSSGATFEFEAGSHLTSLLCQYFVFEPSYKSPGKCAFPGRFDGMWRAKRV